MSKFQKQLAEARRAQILEAAVAVIAEQGFQHTTIKQIANRAEVADGTIYNYFKNKDDILTAIISQISEAEVRDLHFAEAQKLGFADFVRDYVTHRMAELDEGYPILKVVIAETLANPELAHQIYDQVYTPSFVAAEGYIQQEIARGVLPDLDGKMLTRLFAAPMLGMLLLRLLGDAQIAQNWNAYGDLLSESMVKMFSLPPATQSMFADTSTEEAAKKSKKKRKKL